MNSIVHNIDCVEFMRTLPDKHFSLAITDPPYGIGESGGDKKRTRKGKNYNKLVVHKKKSWDNSPPDKEYFDELFRVSENQIIWGANYFTDKLKPSMGWVYWDKRIGGDFSDGELAYTSFNRALRCFSYSYHGDTKGGHTRTHPTQKPIALYTWLLQNYAKQGDTIFDSHMGSQSSRIAAHDLGFDFTGCELDKEYFDAGNKRFKEHITKAKLFTPEQLKVTQTSLL